MLILTAPAPFSAPVSPNIEAPVSSEVEAPIPVREQKAPVDSSETSSAVSVSKKPQSKAEMAAAVTRARMAEIFGLGGRQGQSSASKK
jgi:hypothetical protein